MDSRSQRISILSVLLLCLAGLRPAQAQTTSTTPTLRLLYTSSVQGKLHDCGCKHNPLGGLARRAALLDELSTDASNTIVFDGGNLLPSPRSAENGHAADFASLTAEMGYDVVGVGAREIAQGLPDDLGPARESGLRFVSANLDGAVIEPFAILRRGAQRVALTSVVSPASAVEARDGVAAADPASALARLLPQMREKADLVVLSCAMNLEDTEALLRALPEEARPDLAIVSEGGTHFATSRVVASVPVVAANSMGKYLGQVDFRRGTEGGWQASSTLYPLKLSRPENAEFAAAVDRIGIQ